MTSASADSPRRQRSLRLWPALLLISLELVLWLLMPAVLPDLGMYWFMGRFLCGVGVIAWWAFFSRAPRTERWTTTAFIVLALAATSRLVHPSVAGAGMGLLFYFASVTLLSPFVVVAVLLCRHRSSATRAAALVAGGLLVCGVCMLVRLDGIRGAGGIDYAWRWTPTAEERLLESERASAASAAPRIALDPTADAEWPGFRGPRRDGIVRGLRIATDWSTSPPKELWRRAVGPAWSSFAVQGEALFTQEQRGEEEVVACYRLETGAPVWMHREATRFWEANAGAGPRGTPALHAGRIYAFGATGFLNALDAASGSRIWSRNVAAEADVKVPYWGFASSPLVVGEIVVVAASGRLMSYDLATGEPRWKGAPHAGGYGSPHLLTLGGTPQVVFLNGAGATSVAPGDGAELWQHAWEGGAGMLQPALTGDGDLLITTAGPSGGAGTRRISVMQDRGAWITAERWTSRNLKAYYNDLVVHRGHAYGFDGSILACIELGEGKRKWKGGRYGNGQLLLLAEQDLLLVISEDGELVLVRAFPEEHAEVARHPALEGKTWNHPVLVGDVLLVRNDEEMAGFRVGLEP